jgi:hypothetical protein
MNWIEANAGEEDASREHGLPASFVRCGHPGPGIQDPILHDTIRSAHGCHSVAAALVLSSMSRRFFVHSAQVRSGEESCWQVSLNFSNHARTKTNGTKWVVALGKEEGWRDDPAMFSNEALRELAAGGPWSCILHRTSCTLRSSVGVVYLVLMLLLDVDPPLDPLSLATSLSDLGEMQTSAKNTHTQAMC